MALDFRVLGPVEAAVGGMPVSVTGRPLTLLAGLLVRANTTVSTDLIGHWLWDGDTTAPRRAKGAIQTHVMRLRQAFDAVFGGAGAAVRTVPGGYLLAADEDSLDLLRFEAMVDRAAAAESAGDPVTAARLLAEALDLWRGPALTGVASDALHRDEVPRLAERRLDAWQRLADVRLALGEPPVAELRRLTREHPLRERFWEQLVHGLYVTGRSADALAAYREAATVLAEETGLDPGPALRELRDRVLAGATKPVQPARGDAWVTPRQLPPEVAGFTGRSAELAELAAHRAAGSAAIVVEGTAGVGKTALTIHFGHSVVGEFPDGQVYLNLRGYGPGEPRERRSSLELLLASVGVGHEEIPADVIARETLWRTRTSGRRMLVVLDNVRSTEQVRPLLPGPGSLVIVTSRGELRGLIAREGARRLTVPRLATGDARDLLAEAVGEHRVAADPDGSAALLRLCARLPLAIRILGERASRYPELSLSEFRTDLDDTAGLATFDLADDEETNLRAVFAPSYQGLCDEAAHLFRLLGAHPGPEFGVPVAAALLSVPAAHARFLLDELVRAHLLERPRPGRYEFHDLLREYAAELLRDDPAAADADERVLDWYLAAAMIAFNRTRPGANVAGLDAPAVEFDLADRAAAAEWAELEWTNLVAAVRHACAAGLDRQTWQLARLLQPHLVYGRHLGDWRTTHELGLRSARRLGDEQAEGYLLNGLGILHSRLREDAAAIDSFTRRLAIARRLGDRAGERATLTNLAVVYQRVGRLEAALRAARQAVAICREVGAPINRAIALNNLADVYVGLGRFAEAAEHAGQSYELAHDGGALRSLGRARAGLGERAAAADCLERAVARFREENAQFDTADSLTHLGDARLALDDPPGAREAWTEALALFERLGHHDVHRIHTRLADLDRPANHMSS